MVNIWHPSQETGTHRRKPAHECVIVSFSSASAGRDTACQILRRVDLLKKFLEDFPEPGTKGTPSADLPRHLGLGVAYQL